MGWGGGGGGSSDALSSSFHHISYTIGICIYIYICAMFFINCSLSLRHDD